MLQDASTYHQYRWENYIYKENCTKCAASETAYVCSFTDKSLGYCTNCKEITCNDSKLLKSIQHINMLQRDVSILFNERVEVPADMYTKIGISAGHLCPTMAGLSRVMGAFPSPVVGKLIKEAGMSVTDVGGKKLYDYINNARRYIYYRDSWVFMLPLSIAPGVQTGWWLWDGKDKIGTATLSISPFPAPHYIFLHIPKTVEHVCEFTSIQEAAAYAAMQKANKNSNAMILLRSDNIDL